MRRTLPIRISPLERVSLSIHAHHIHRQQSIRESADSSSCMWLHTYHTCIRVVSSQYRLLVAESIKKRTLYHKRSETQTNRQYISLSPLSLLFLSLSPLSLSLSLSPPSLSLSLSLSPPLLSLSLS